MLWDTRDRLEFHPYHTALVESKQMNEYRHHVSGFFADRTEATDAISALVERGLPRERLQMFDADSAPPAPAPERASNKVLNDVLVDGAIGTAVGTGIGALGELALVAANVSLFVASPLIAPLMMLGWGASLGGFIGAVAGASGNSKNEEKHFADLIRDAIINGQFVVVADTRAEAETEIAREVIQASIGEYHDVRNVARAASVAEVPRV
jgi:hypothetical protein